MIKDIVSQDISVVLAVMDQDRHTGSVEMGRATITLKVFVGIGFKCSTNTF